MNSSSSTDSLLADAVEDVLRGHCDLRVVRRIEAGESADGLWRQLTDSGFADALVPAASDGAGLSLREASPIAIACGRHVLPLPLALTMPVRAALALRGLAVPEGPITIAPHAVQQEGGVIEAASVPYLRTAQWVLVSDAQRDLLLPVAAATRVTCAPRELSGRVRWERLPSDALAWSRSGDAAGSLVDWLAMAAALTAAQMAGAMQRVCEMTVNYANERVQFGKPIARLQAIQQQISVLAEQVWAVRSGASIGLCPVQGTALCVEPLRAAVAKARASEAVVAVTAIAHAVHGAIGVSEEYDLQMLTRQLHEWRAQYGSESHWNTRLGATLLADERSALQFIQQRIAPGAMAFTT